MRTLLQSLRQISEYRGLDLLDLMSATSGFADSFCSPLESEDREFAFNLLHDHFRGALRPLLTKYWAFAPNSTEMRGLWEAADIMSQLPSPYTYEDVIVALLRKFALTSADNENHFMVYFWVCEMVVPTLNGDKMQHSITDLLHQTYESLLVGYTRSLSLDQGINQEVFELLAKLVKLFPVRFLRNELEVTIAELENKLYKDHMTQAAADNYLQFFLSVVLENIGDLELTAMLTNGVGNWPKLWVVKVLVSQVEATGKKHLCQRLGRFLVNISHQGRIAAETVAHIQNIAPSLL